MSCCQSSFIQHPRCNVRRTCMMLEKAEMYHSDATIKCLDLAHNVGSTDFCPFRGLDLNKWRCHEFLMRQMHKEIAPMDGHLIDLCCGDVKRSIDALTSHHERCWQSGQPLVIKTMIFTRSRWSQKDGFNDGKAFNFRT